MLVNDAWRDKFKEISGDFEKETLHTGAYWGEELFRCKGMRLVGERAFQEKEVYSDEIMGISLTVREIRDYVVGCKEEIEAALLQNIDLLTGGPVYSPLKEWQLRARLDLANRYLN